ncbi:acyl carrier protein [Amycolatopsis sp. 195334CR]|uniref:acyl carrier protein n=1 Tax=Amycolatopsis sp. 195334CR TaxID=2814588 RepID=UPI001A90900C|nr:acyl carrier protein [Amycolatopsis sp. 195334CR]MBN6039756.1 acyl carrier protein [Amycolatopsis sp. 195334CR]
MNTEELEQALLRYVRTEFLFGDEDEELELTSPLLEWGILDSLRTALLMTHVREEYGVHISPAKISARNFRDIRTIAGLVLAESAAASHR